MELVHEYISIQYQKKKPWLKRIIRPVDLQNRIYLNDFIREVIERQNQDVTHNSRDAQIYFDGQLVSEAQSVSWNSERAVSPEFELGSTLEYAKDSVKLPPIMKRVESFTARRQIEKKTR